MLLGGLGTGGRRRAPSSSTRCSRSFAFERGQRRAHPRPRRLRDLRSSSCSCCARCRSRRAINRAALGAARGPRLGGVPRAPELPERFRDQIAVVVPAYNEADNVGRGARADPGRGLRASRPRCSSSTTAPATAPARSPRAHGAVVARHVINRGGGAALRTGYRLMSSPGPRSSSPSTPTASTSPRRWSAWSKPILDGEVDVAHGSRVLGHADRNHFARASWASSSSTGSSRFITRTKVTDCSNGYRAVRTTVLPQLVLRQEQFHTSEFMIEAIKRGIPAKEVPVTVEQAPARPLQEAGRGPLRPRLRQRDRPHLAAVAAGPAPRTKSTSSSGGGRIDGEEVRGPDRIVVISALRAPAPAPPLFVLRTASSLGVVHLGRVGEVEVGAAAGADLDVELQDLAAGGARRSGSVCSER